VLEAAAGGCSSTMAMSDPCPGFVASQWRIAANAGEPVPLYQMQMMLYSMYLGCTGNRRYTALFVDVKCGRRGVGPRPPRHTSACVSVRVGQHLCRCALRGRILPPRAARSGAPAGTAVHRPPTPSSRRAVCRRGDHGRSLPAVRSGRQRRVSSRNWSPSSVTCRAGSPGCVPSHSSASGVRCGTGSSGGLDKCGPRTHA
jgi:hypothetical protein